MDLERIRRRWTSNAMAEIAIWRSHVDVRASDLKGRQLRGTFEVEEAELIFAICVIFNRLAQIDLRTADHIKEDSALIPWLVKVTEWPKDVAKVFWYAIRNPTMHLGRAVGLADYGVQVKQGAAPLHGSLAKDLEFDPVEYHGNRLRGDGWDISDALVNDQARRLVTFYYPGVLRALDRAILRVKAGLETATQGELEALGELNRRLPFLFLMPEDLPGGDDRD